MRLMPFILVTLAGCADFPALDGTVTDAARAAPYPTLQPLGQIDASDSDTDTQLTARVAALQARAATLRLIDIAALQ